MFKLGNDYKIIYIIHTQTCAYTYIHTHIHTYTHTHTHTHTHICVSYTCIHTQSMHIAGVQYDLYNCYAVRTLIMTIMVEKYSLLQNVADH